MKETEPMNFEQWYECSFDTLTEAYISDNPEDFPTKESMIDIDKKTDFQSYCDVRYNSYVNTF